LSLVAHHARNVTKTVAALRGELSETWPEIAAARILMPLVMARRLLIEVAQG
jgi:hypothetical protein